jgi:hypothetical protein
LKEFLKELRHLSCFKSFVVSVVYIVVCSSPLPELMSLVVAQASLPS